LDIGYSLLAVGYSKKWGEDRERAVPRFREDVGRYNKLKLLTELRLNKGELIWN
jgi:hypothetical protein